MIPYKYFSRYYDLVMGDRSEAARFIEGLIADHKPDTRTVIEIACGTGSILGILSRSYEVAGLDGSRPMLAHARKKLPHVRFYRQDITSFRVKHKFDVIVCAFDSINHLLRLTDWKRTFRTVARHLNPGGLFIFDVNTTGKLQRLTEGPAWERWLGSDLAIIKVTGGRRNKFIWDVKIFERQRRNLYKLVHEEIPETAFPLRRVVTALQDRFTAIKVFDPFGANASDLSERLYFVCKVRQR